MNGTSLPLNCPEWRDYFKYLEMSISGALKKASYGINKFMVIRDEMKKCYRGFNAKTKNLLTINEVQYMLEFAKTSSAFLTIILKYQDKKWLNYVLSAPLSKQYDELAQIFTAYSVCASFLEPSAFADIEPLMFAHNLDLALLHKVIKEYVPTMRKESKLKDALKITIDRIEVILRKPSDTDLSPNAGLVYHKEFENIEEIGHGAYAKVYKAKYKNKDIVAVKELTRIDMPARKLYTLKRELNCLIQLKHPNVINLIGVTVTPPFSILTKYIANGSLYSQLEKNPEQLNNTRRMKIAIGIARALEYLDLIHIVHRDIKPQNVLLDDNDMAILCDFGLSRNYGPKMTAELGTVTYMAPELIGNAYAVYDTSVDTYSFGLLLYDLLVGANKYPNWFPLQIAMSVVKNKWRPELPAYAPTFGELIVQCWSQNPRKRPKMTNIRKYLEQGRAILDNVDKRELRNWIDQTQPAHLEALKRASETMQARDKNLVKSLHTLNPIDPAAPQILQNLFQSEIPVTIEIINDLFKLIDQRKSEEVSQIAGEILKMLLTKDDIESVISWDALFNKFLEISKTRPELALEAIKSFSDRFKDPIVQITEVEKLPASHFSIDVVEVLLSSNDDLIDPLRILPIFKTKDGNFLTALFRCILNIFGPTDSLLDAACSLAPLLSIYMSSLAKRARNDFQGVNKLLGASKMFDFEFEDDENSTSSSKNNTNSNPTSQAYEDGDNELATLLDELTNALLSPRLEKVTVRCTELIMTCIIPRCSDFVSPFLYAICAYSGYFDVRSAPEALWKSCLAGFDYPEITPASLNIIMYVPAEIDTKYVVDVWKKLVHCFVETYDPIYEDAIVKMCSQSADFDVEDLVTAILKDFENHVEQSIKIAEAFNGKQAYTLGTDELWDGLMKVIPNAEYPIVQKVGEFMLGVFEKADIGTNADFIATSLNFVYKDDVPFEVAKPYLDILAKLCNQRNILVFCAKRHLGEYIKQLPWKYPEVTGVPVVINKFLSVVA